MLRRVMKQEDAFYPGTPYATHFLIEAMIRTGMEEAAARYLEDYWGDMVIRGADTFWEVYDP
ncbi:MAG: hypothetical protein LUD15_02305 [Bacteroides sp.]|nr:hypothetical protein [Bacteroides sp.]